ncbi:hypothetical protein HaLaN_13542, partial [Haematococcus lacustris]
MDGDDDGRIVKRQAKERRNSRSSRKAKEPLTRLQHESIRDAHVQRRSRLRARTACKTNHANQLLPSPMQVGTLTLSMGH